MNKSLEMVFEIGWTAREWNKNRHEKSTVSLVFRTVDSQLIPSIGSGLLYFIFYLYKTIHLNSVF